MRKLLTDTDYNTLAPNTEFFDPNDPESYKRLPYYPYGTYMDIMENKGEGQLHALQAGLTRRWRNGLAFDVVYTYAHSDTTVPDSGNSTIGVVLYNPRDPMGDRGPDPNVVKHRLVANATWDIPVGKSRKHGSTMPGWANALFGGWTVSTIFQARSGLNLTPYFYGLHLDEPLEHGQGARRSRQLLQRLLAPERDRRPEHAAARGTSGSTRRRTASRLRASSATRRRAPSSGPGTWVVNFSIYKDVVAKDRFRLQFTALLDNAFNHPQFFPAYGDPLHRHERLPRRTGSTNNGVTANLGAGTISNAEGFAPGRVFRIGIRATF